MPKLHPTLVSLLLAGFCFNLVILKMTVFAKPAAPDEIVVLPEHLGEEKKGEWSFCDYQEPETPVFSMSFVESSVSEDLEGGSTFKAKISYKNTGNARIYSEQSHCEDQAILSLGTQMAQDRASVFGDDLAVSGWKAPNRVFMKNAYADPGDLLVFEFESQIPAVAENDLYREFFQPVLEGVGWMGEVLSLDIVVGQVTEQMADDMKYVEDLSINAASLAGLTRNIEVDISEQKQYARFGELRVWGMQISSGAGDTPTPRGEYKILNKQELRIAGGIPRWRMPYWQGFRNDGYGIHALPYLGGSLGHEIWQEADAHLGIPVSHGCIRAADADAIKLFEFTELGTPVSVHQ